MPDIISLNEILFIPEVQYTLSCTWILNVKWLKIYLFGQHFLIFSVHLKINKFMFGYDSMDSFNFEEKKTYIITTGPEK